MRTQVQASLLFLIFLYYLKSLITERSAPSGIKELQKQETRAIIANGALQRDAFEMKLLLRDSALGYS